MKTGGRPEVFNQALKFTAHCSTNTRTAISCFCTSKTPLYSLKYCFLKRPYFHNIIAIIYKYNSVILCGIALLKSQNLTLYSLKSILWPVFHCLGGLKQTCQNTTGMQGRHVRIGYVIYNYSCRFFKCFYFVGGKNERKI